MKNKLLPIVFCSFLAIISLLTVILPKKTKSENEKRMLKTFPEFSVSSVMDGTYNENLESYVADHILLREQLYGINSYVNCLLGMNGRNGVYADSNGYLIAAATPLNEEKAEKNIGFIKKFADKINVPTTILSVPTKGYILQNNLPDGFCEYYDDFIFDKLAENGLSVIDLREEFKASDKQLYYYTDHHTNSNASLVMYKSVCDKMHLEYKPFELAETYSDFYGTAYSKSGLWLAKPDTVEIYKPLNASDFSVLVEGKDEYKSMFFEDKLDTQDKYEVFLGGNHGLTKITNNSVKNGKKLLIIKDSFANCVTTMLAENFEEVYLIDPRYYTKSTQELIKETDFTEVLFIYGVENLASSSDISKINY